MHLRYLTCHSKEKATTDNMNNRAKAYLHRLLIVCTNRFWIVLSQDFVTLGPLSTTSDPLSPQIPPVLVVYIHLIDECVCRTQP